MDAGARAQTDPLLRVEDLTVEIGGASVVDGVSFAVEGGRVLALVGESGCGKSLTSFAMLGLLPPAARRTKGRIRLEETDLSALSERQFRRIRGRDISIIFQEPSASLDPLSTVGSQVAEAYRAHHKVSLKEAMAAARSMLADVGIPDPDRRLHQYPFELSGGMCQRIMISIALICAPRVLVADEPTTALDVTIQAQILDLMKRLVAERGTAVVIITHDMGVVADIADDVAVMYAGRVAEIAPVDRLFARPQHPYTALLLASVPKPGHPPKADLATIEGMVPAPHEFGAGCRFTERCPLADRRCREEQPPLFERGTRHRSACWHADRIAEIRDIAA
ncbi:ABC transporter ATP-binding protein [Aureimonas jatrophae]|uniref:Peptide/nickel transport system ATP-binding protein n=1 Tax=Aureimonas jatrophae TaxID=1166073 RepID=A0A1H0FDX4_9HYPH|nr:ABC transporter ATP-binding protein [Aureimonas jatrophae]MBB3950061.1 peptide/nickel transport system ATP-binding protein [Aureimonas jatrophae]SDN92873.1 peptide/nickel transport system ATP-binding protein [Aureimonas jatrophae]